MDVIQTLKALAVDFENMDTDIQAVTDSLTSLPASRLCVETITMCATTTLTDKFGNTRSNTLLKLYDCLSSTGNLVRYVRKVRRLRKDSKPLRGFNNAIMVKYKNEINIKVFNNFKLQLAGCKSVADFIAAAQATCGVLQRLMKDATSGAFTDEVKISTVSVSMINVRFYSNCNLDLSAICCAAREHIGVGDGSVLSIEHNPERSAAINIEYRTTSGSAKIMVYKGGCIKVMALRKPEEALAVYTFITSLLDDNWTKVQKDCAETEESMVPDLFQGDEAVQVDELTRELEEALEEFL